MGFVFISAVLITIQHEKVNRQQMIRTKVAIKKLLFRDGQTILRDLNQNQGKCLKVLTVTNDNVHKHVLES